MKKMKNCWNVIIENNDDGDDGYLSSSWVRCLCFESDRDNNLNQVMKFLITITIILELPTMISGLYGMNVNCWNAVCDESIWVCSNLDFSLIVCLIAVYFMYFAEENIYYKILKNHTKWFFMCWLERFSSLADLLLRNGDFVCNFCCVFLQSRILIISYSRSGRCSCCFFLDGPPNYLLCFYLFTWSKVKYHLHPDKQVHKEESLRCIKCK